MEIKECSSRECQARVGWRTRSDGRYAVSCGKPSALTTWNWASMTEDLCAEHAQELIRAVEDVLRLEPHGSTG